MDGGGIGMTTIYYFSATGNCMTSANLLADLLPTSCQVIPIVSLKNKKEIWVSDEQVGFVFPVYYGDMPYLVREIVDKMIFKGNPYIFLMTTYRGHPGDVAKRFEKVLWKRGQHLSLCTGIAMPGNSYLSTDEETKQSLLAQKENIQICANRIIAQEKEDYTLAPYPEDSKVSHLVNFRGIMADEKCVGCGICAQVCPMDNIQIQDGHALIGDACMTCLTCFHWCPQEAIYMSKEPKIARREKYHHPDVCLQDIFDEQKRNH